MITKFNIRLNIDETGDINLQRCFHDAYGSFPLCYSPYVFQDNKDMGDDYNQDKLDFDIDQFKIDLFNELSNYFTLKTINYKLCETWNFKYIGFSNIEKNHLVCYFNNTKDFFIFYDLESEDVAMKIANEVFVNTFIKNLKRKEEPKNTINLLTAGNAGFELVGQEIAPIILDINQNFNDDFHPVNEIINNSIEENKSGLIILHGKQGTGKTTYIRHLVNTHNRKFILLNNAVMNSFTDPQFIKFLSNQKDSIIIVEDCEQLLKDRKEKSFKNCISSVLNITDGIYSDILKIKIIATFNTDITNIDPALLRKGRLIAKYDFQELSLEKTNNLLKSLNLPESNEPLTLADIYNNEDMSFSDTNCRVTIGL